MKVVCLAGDGIGPEVMEAAMRVLEPLPLELESYSFGGEAIHRFGNPLPVETLAACKGAQAVLLGAIGLPEFDGAVVRPEQGLIQLRGELDVYANLRPSTDGGKVDLMIVRELVGGTYYGRRGRTEDGLVFDTCEYTEPQIERTVRRAFALAMKRRKHLTEVDKANVLATSRLWRQVTERVRPEFPEVELEYMLVDNAAMQLARTPEQFDVIVTRTCSATSFPILPLRSPAVSGWPHPRRSPMMAPACSSQFTAPPRTSPAKASPIQPRCSDRWR